MSSAAVTVIIPAFNCAQWLSQAIDSVLSQSVAPREIIVVNDGSTDGTAAVLAEYAQYVRCVDQPNQGAAAARNAGLGLADGDLIAFLDADDVWHPRKLELQLSALAGRPEIGLLGTRTFPWPAVAMPEESGPGLRMIDRDHLAVKNYLATSSILLRREVVRRVGEFDVTLCGPEDHDYWLRIAEVAGVATLKAQLTGYRTVYGSLSTRAGSMEAGMHRILLKLDSRDFWRGNQLLRRRAYSYASYSGAQLHGAADEQWTAISRLLDSLLWYPLPLRRGEAGAPCGRLRRLAVSLLRLAGLARNPGRAAHGAYSRSKRKSRALSALPLNTQVRFVRGSFDEPSA
jgi:glycosyltransferase involved in cell wall biosynthesis